jgi:hypothetical protein
MKKEERRKKIEDRMRKYSGSRSDEVQEGGLSGVADNNFTAILNSL